MIFPLFDTYGDETTVEFFTQEAMFEGWLRSEVALAKAQSEVGIIPAEAAKEIEESAKYEKLDITGFWDEVKNVGYPIVPLVKRLSQAAGDSGGYVHWGATTQDIMDTGIILQLKNAVHRLEELLVHTGDSCAVIIEKHANTPQAGRTHGQQAVPITFGMKVSVWLAEITRHLQRLQEMKSRLLVGQLFGAAGTLATLGGKSEQVRIRYCEILELNVPDGPWHVARDIVVEYANLQALISGTLKKMAREIADLARTEIKEVSEAKGKLRGASSTMPQKENPISSETIIGMTTINISLVSGLFQTLAPGHERATGEWQAEWDMVPMICVGTAGSLLLMNETLDSLAVDSEMMKNNLKKDHGLIMAESVMMKLTNKLGKQVAHEKMYDVCQRADQEDKELVDVLIKDRDVTRILSVADIKEACNPLHYIGEAVAISKRTVDSWNVLQKKYQLKS